MLLHLVAFKVLFFIKFLNYYFVYIKFIFYYFINFLLFQQLNSPLMYGFNVLFIFICPKLIFYFCIPYRYKSHILLNSVFPSSNWSTKWLVFVRTYFNTSLFILQTFSNHSTRLHFITCDYIESILYEIVSWIKIIYHIKFKNFINNIAWFFFYYSIEIIIDR